MDDILKRARGELDDLVSAVDSTQVEADNAVKISHEASRALEDVEGMIEEIIDTYTSDIKERDDRIEELETEKNDLESINETLNVVIEELMVTKTGLEADVESLSSVDLRLGGYVVLIGSLVCVIIIQGIIFW
jgi:gas vesicle protein